MSKQIKVTIDPMGNPKVEAEGFVGTSCEAATAALENMLAGREVPTDKQYKPEYSQSEEVAQTQTW